MKRITLIFMMLLMAVVSASAADPLNVAGVDVKCNADATITGGDIKSGTVTYTKSTNTLTLTNVTITRTSSGSYCIHNRSQKGLIIKFIGNCNLTSTKARVIRDQSGGENQLVAASGAIVNFNGFDDGAIYVRDFTTLWIKGPGTFNIYGQKSGAIMGHGPENSSTSDLATIDYVKFSNVTATVTGEQGAIYNAHYQFSAGSNVTLKATNNSSYPVARKCQVYLRDNTAILAPWGAISTGDWNSQITLNGSNVYNKDIFISDNYALLLNSTNFPSANFRNAMLALYPKGYLTSYELQNLTSLNVANKSISDMTGVEKLTYLKELRCYGNTFTSLNVSALTRLTYLDCAPNNNLTSLNVSGCTNLEGLICYGTGITSLSLSNQSKLKRLLCYTTKLTSLTVSNKSNLTELQCQNCTSLTTLSCNNNALTSLNVTGNTALKELRCYYNANLSAITGLASCTALTYIDCEDCRITDLSACNSMSNLEQLYARNNKLTGFTMTNKSKLTYVRLLGNTSMTTAEITGNSKLATLYISGCTALTTLSCQKNALTTLDVKSNSALKELRCYNNQLTSLDLSGCTALTLLDCAPNSNLSSISALVNCTAVKTLYCYSTALTDLSAVNSMPNLETLYCYNTKISSLTLTNKTKLNTVQAYDNTNLIKADIYDNSKLSTLNIYGCPALTTLRCYDNNLTTLSLSGNTALTLLNCHNNIMTSLDVSAQTNLTELYCYNNQLTTLNVNNNSKLKYLFCYNNKLTSLNVSGKTSLIYLQCNDNQLTSLNVQGCSNLANLYCNGNKLTSLYVQGCNALRTVNCYSNKITDGGMSTLVNSLPSNTNTGTGTLRVLYNTGENNVFTNSHAAAASAKNWNSFRYNGADWVIIPVSTRGDVNGDGEVNIADVNALISMILTNKTQAVGDINGDGEINLADVNHLIDLILRK